eukprot:scaffold86218_cov66-Phaeocystis_antarctica.AAC.9
MGSCLPAGLPRAQRRRNLLRDGARPWRVLRVTVGEGAGSTPVSRGGESARTGPTELRGHSGSRATLILYAHTRPQLFTTTFLWRRRR